jgi:hypothetical protein
LRASSDLVVMGTLPPGAAAGVLELVPALLQPVPTVAANARIAANARRTERFERIELPPEDLG